MVIWVQVVDIPMSSLLSAEIFLSEISGSNVEVINLNAFVIDFAILLLGRNNDNEFLNAISMELSKLLSLYPYISYVSVWILKSLLQRMMQYRRSMYTGGEAYAVAM